MADALAWAWPGLAWLGRVAWQASVLIVLVLLVQRAFRRRLSPAWRHALWLLVVARLALPASLESRASIFNWLHLGSVPSVLEPAPAPVTVPVVLTASAWESVSGKSAAALTPSPTVASEKFPAAGKLWLGAPAADRAPRAGTWNTLAPWLAGVWLAGVLLLAVRIAAESVRLQRLIAPKRLVTDSAVLELLEDCKQLMDVRAPLVLVQTACISSPVLYGFIRPRLVLPEGLLKEFSRDELRFVFLHELAHVRRHDIALSWLMAGLQALHWFNPFVWIAFRHMKADRELACDALVLARTSAGEQKAYGRTMLRLLEGFARPKHFPALAGILEDPAQLKTRIQGIARFNGRPPSPVFALGAAAALALVALTDRRVVAAPQIFSVWPAQFALPRTEGGTELRSILLRPEPGIDLQQALDRGGLRLASGTECASLVRDGYKLLGGVDGLGLDRWRRCTREGAPAPRVAHTVVWTGQEMLVWGGGARDLFKQTGARYNPVTDTWRPITTNGAPSGRWQHAAQWTGREMIIWGGRAHYYPTNSLSDGGLYDPETDTWRPMNGHGAPTARSQMTSVWTGREFIVWGGRTDGGTNAYDTPFNDGARYHPETDAWTPMADCPELGPRYDAAAVWTGTEMILWGGGRRTGTSRENQHPYLTHADGGRYDPALNQWTLLPAEGAPRGRYKHTAVWTGEEMLVWGGTTVTFTGEPPKQGNSSFQDGARFSPATGRWSPISTHHAPGERSSHLAAWSGSEMIVWGGGNSKSECLNTGARYDPKTDRWWPLTGESAPAPRFMMRPDAGLWTGREFYVVGGYDLNTEFGTSHAWSPAPALALYQRVR